MLIFTVTISIFSLLIGFFTLFSLCVCVIFCDQHVNRPTGNIKYDANLLYFNDIIGKILRNMRPTKNSGCWSPLPTVNSASFFPEFRIIANSDQQKENDDQQETTAYFYLINIYIIDYYIFILYLFWNVSSFVGLLVCWPLFLSFIGFQNTQNLLISFFNFRGSGGNRWIKIEPASRMCLLSMASNSQAIS